MACATHGQEATCTPETCSAFIHPSGPESGASKLARLEALIAKYESKASEMADLVDEIDTLRADLGYSREEIVRARVLGDGK